MLYLFGLNKDMISYSCVIGIFVLGLITFILPQVVYIRVVSASEDLYCQIIKRRFSSSNPNLGTSEGVIRALRDEIPDIGEMGSLVNLLNYDQWVYPLHQTYIVVGMYALSLISYNQAISIVKSTMP